MFEAVTDLMQSEDQRRAFGTRLKELRNQKRWTQKEVAARIGLQLSQFNKYESAMVPVDRTALPDVAAAPKRRAHAVA